MMIPAATGPVAMQTVNTHMRMLLPSRNSPAGAVTPTIEALSSARAVSPSRPSSPIAASTRPNDPVGATTVSPAKMSASPISRAGSAGPVSSSSRATIEGATSDGRNWPTIITAATAAGLWVRSSTNTDSAIWPSQLPSALIAYAPIRRRNASIRIGLHTPLMTHLGWIGGT